MFPQTEIIKILGHLKRKYKDRFYYKMKFGEVDIDLITREVDVTAIERYPTHIFDKTVITKSFTFDEVLSWHKNPEREFERSWQNK